MANIFEFPSGKDKKLKDEGVIGVPSGEDLNDKSEDFLGDKRTEHFKKLLKSMHGVSLTVMTEEQFVRLGELKRMMMSFKNNTNLSSNAYEVYFNELNKSNVAELAPILENLSDKDFQSRPAYAQALIDVLEKKDLLEAQSKLK